MGRPVEWGDLQCALRMRNAPCVAAAVFLRKGHEDGGCDQVRYKIGVGNEHHTSVIAGV